MNTENENGRSPAVRYAEAGADAWRSVVHVQGSADPDHADWYAVTGEMVETLRCLAAMTSVLTQQIRGYGHGRVLRDDAGLDPAERLEDSVRRAEWLRAHLDIAERSADDLWSQISHIAVEVDR